MFDKALDLIHDVNFRDGASKERLTLKALEELGELAEAINWETGYKNTDKTPREINVEQTKECIDVLVCIIAILDKIGATDDTIKKYYKKKIDKWEKNLDKKKK